MKIVGVDNLARESVADVVMLEGIPENQKDAAQRICDIMNRGLGDGPGTHFTLKPDDYRPWGGMKELV